jgi:hypothetical protein
VEVPGAVGDMWQDIKPAVMNAMATKPYFDDNIIPPEKKYLLSTNNSRSILPTYEIKIQ